MDKVPIWAGSAKGKESTFFCAGADSGLGDMCFDIDDVVICSAVAADGS